MFVHDFGPSMTSADTNTISRIEEVALHLTIGLRAAQASH
jgi:hypothetical protein